MADNDGNEQAMYQEATPNSDLKVLDRLVGTWNVTDPAGPNGVNGQIRYEWMEGGFFLLQYVDLTSDGRPIKGIEIIGHEQTFGGEPSADIKSRYYGSTGETLDYVYEVEGDTVTIWGGEKGSPAYYKGTFSDDGNTLTGGWVYPGGGGYGSVAVRA